MSKKKHQRDPNNGDESSESGDENQNGAECTHIGKAIDLNRVKKSVIKSGFLTDCEDCKKQPPDPDLADLELELDLSLWLCLKCGNQACGRGKSMHALMHFETPHSDSHCMCVNTTIWSIWCYDCDNEVNVTCKKKLQEAVEYLKKQAESNKIKQQVPTPTIADKLYFPALLQNVIWLYQYTINCMRLLVLVYDYYKQVTLSKVIEVVSTLPGITSNTGAIPKRSVQLGPSGLARARGLTNLGNTCFFNSVMQCLGQTPYLLTLLEETATSGQSFRLPGGQLKLKDKDEIELPELEGQTEKWRPLTQTLAETLRELQSGRPEVYNPRNLLQKLTFRMPQFGGGDQHDSHELLRHLLEAVREEDQKRFKVVILEKLGLNSKTHPSTVDEQKKQIIKFYGQQVSEMMLATEQVFRGVLVSTLQCQVCQHVSHRDENFLDLSLPISEKQMAPILRRKADDIEDNKPSKHQMKKEKRAERKKNKKQKNNRNSVMSVNSVNSEDVPMENDYNNSDSEESDADVEDNVEEISNNVIPLPAPPDDFAVKGTESGYNSDKIENSSPDSNNRLNSPADITIDDSGVPSPVASGGAGVTGLSPNSPDNSPASSETNVDMGSPLLGNNSPDEDFSNSSFQRPVSRLAFTESKSNNVDLKVDLEKLSLINDGDSSKMNSAPDGTQEPEGACAIDPTDSSSEMMDQDEDDSDDIVEYSGTLAPRYQCEEGECSVESCLNQFTECELLMGTNKVSCDLCTKRHGVASKKTIYTDASKQLLIYNPPAVLILHLKRFQVYRYRSAKVSKFVKFSTHLDLGPFVSKRSQNLPTFEQGQTKVLYSLYGVVEHSGSIHGGHYVSYVKVRAPLDPESPRWNFIPKNQRTKLNKIQPGASGEPEPPPGKWYYISDSYVSEVAESKVLSAQAYLLFYERIL